MKISVDVDGVLGRFDDAVIKIANTLWPGRLPENYEPVNWEYTDVFDSKDWDALWKHIDRTFNFWQFIPAYKDNLAALQGFFRSHTNEEIYHVTSRGKVAGSPVSIQTQTWMMVQGIFPHRNYQAILPVEHAWQKAAVMEALGIEYSIDDYGKTVEECSKVKGHKAYVLDRPWNRDKDYGPRVYSLQEFFDTVTRANSN